MSDIGKVILLNKNGKDGQFLPVPRNSEQDIVIGKSATADIRIKNVDVADLHCSISYNGYKATIRPLSKSATTFVNNSAIKGQQTVVLKHNDLIQVEDRTFRWEYVQDTDEPSSKSPVKGQRKSEPAIKLMTTGVPSTSNRSMILSSPVFKRRSLMLKKPPVALLSTSKTNKANASLRKINKTPGLNRSHLNSAAKLKNPNILRVLKQGCGFLASPSSSQDIGGEVNVVSGVLSSPVKSQQSFIQQGVGRNGSPGKSPMGKSSSPMKNQTSSSIEQGGRVRSPGKSPVGKLSSPVKSPQSQATSRNVVLNGKSATSPRKTVAKSGSPQGTKSARLATSNKKKRAPMSPKMSRAKRKLDLNESNGYEDEDSMVEDGTDGTVGSGNPAEFFSLSEEEEDVEDGTADMINPSPSSLYEDSVCSLPDSTASLFHSTALGAGGSTPRNPKTPQQQNLSKTAPISSTRNSSNRIPCYHPSRNLSKTTTPTAPSVSRSNVTASGSRSRTLNNSAVNRTTNASRASTNKNVSHNTTVTNSSVLVSPRHNSTSRRVYSNNNSRSRRSSRSPEFESTLNFWENLEEESTASVTGGGKSPSKSRNNSTRGGLSVLNGTSSRVSSKSLLSPLYVSPGTNTSGSSFYTPQQQSHSLPLATDKQHSAIFTPYTCDLSPNSRIGTPLAGSGITSPIIAYDSVTAEEIQAALSAAAQAAQQDTPPTTPAHTPSPRESSRKNTPSAAAASSSKKTPTPPANTRTPRRGASQKSTPSSSPATKSPRNSRKSASASTPQSATKNISSASSSSFGGSSKKSTPAAKKGSSTPSSPAKSSPKTPPTKSSTKKSPATKSSPKTPAAKKTGATPKRPSLVVTPGKKKLTVSPKSCTKKSPATSSPRKSTTPKSASKKTPSSKTPSSKRTTPSSKASTPRSPVVPKTTPAKKSSTPSKSPTPRKKVSLQIALKKSTPGRKTPAKRNTVGVTPQKKTPAKKSIPASSAQKKTPRGATLKEVSTSEQDDQEEEIQPLFSGSRGLASPLVVYNLVTPDELEVAETISLPLCSAVKTPTPPSRNSPRQSSSVAGFPASTSKAISSMFNASRSSSSPLVVYNLVTEDEIAKVESISLPLCSVHDSPGPSSSVAGGKKSASCTKTCFNAGRKSSSPLVVYNLVTEDELIGDAVPPVGFTPGKTARRSPGGFPPAHPPSTVLNTSRSSSSPLVVYNLVTPGQLSHVAEPLEEALLDSTPVTDLTHYSSAQTSAQSRKASSSVKKSAATPASTRKTATKGTALPQASAIAGPSNTTAAGQIKKSLRFLDLPSPTVKGTPGKTRGSTRGSMKPVEDSVVVLNSTKTSSRKRKLAETIDLDDVDPSTMFSPDFSLRPSSVSSKSGVLSPRLSTPYPLKKRSTSSSTAGQRVSFDPNLKSSLPPPAVASKHRKSSLKTVYERSSIGKGHHNSFSSNDSSLNYSDVSDLGRQRQGFTSTPMPTRGGGVNTGTAAGATRHLQSILKTTSSREDLNGSVGAAGNGSFSGGSEKSLRFNSHVDFSSTFDDFDSPQITRDVFVSPLTKSAMENNTGDETLFNISRNKSTRQENQSRSAVAARSLLEQNSMNVSRNSRSTGKSNTNLSANISRNRSTRLDKSVQSSANASRSNKSGVRGRSLSKSPGRLSQTSSSGSQSVSPQSQRRVRGSISPAVSSTKGTPSRGSISPKNNKSSAKKNSSVKANSSAKKNSSKKSLNSSRESSVASSSAESSRSKTTASSSKSSGLNGSIYDMETLNSTGIQGIEALAPSPTPTPRQAPPSKSPRASVHLNKYKHFLMNKTPNQGYKNNLTGLGNLFASDDEQEMLSPVASSPATATSARASGKKSTTKRPPSSVTVTTTVKIELAPSASSEQTSTRKTRKTRQVEISPSPVKSPVQVRGRAASTRKTIVASSPAKSPVKKGRAASKKTQQVEASSSPAGVQKSPEVKSRAASRQKRQVEEKRPSVPSPKSPVAKRTTRGRKTAVVVSQHTSPAAAAASVPRSSSRAAKATAQLLLDTILVTDKTGGSRKKQHTPAASPISVVPAKKSRKQTASSELPLSSPSPKKSSRRTTALAKQSPKKVVTPKASRSRSAKANTAEAPVPSSSTSKPAASKRKTRAEKPLPSPPASKKQKRGETAPSPARSKKVSSPASKKSKRVETTAAPAPKVSSSASKKSKRGETAAAPSKKVSSPAAVTPVKTRRGRAAATTMISSPVPSASKTTKKATNKSSQPAASVAVASPVEKGKRGRGRASAKTDTVASPKPGPSSKPTTPKKQTRSKRGTVIVTPVKSATKKSPKPASVKKVATKKSPKPTRSRKTTKSTSPTVATKAIKSTKNSPAKTTKTPTPNKVQKKVVTPKKTTTAKAAKAAVAKKTAKPQVVQNGKKAVAAVKASTSAASKKTKVQTKTAATTPKTSPSPKVAKRTRAASSKQATTAASKKPAAKRPSLLVKKKIQSPKTQRPKRGAKK